MAYTNNELDERAALAREWLQPKELVANAEPGRKSGSSPAEEVVLARIAMEAAREASIATRRAAERAKAANIIASAALAIALLSIIISFVKD